MQKYGNVERDGLNQGAILKYVFVPNEVCDMCGSRSPEHILLGSRLNRSQGRRPRTASGISVSIKRCQRCDLIFPDPLPIPEQLSDHYGTPVEEYWREAYFDYDDTYFKSEIDLAKKLLNATDRKLTALDIGAGIGKAMISLERAGFDTYGIEPSEPFRDKAISRMGINPDRLQLSTIEEAQFLPSTFDFVTFGAVLEHLYFPSKAIGKALEWLKPGGVIQIEVPSSNHLISKILNFYYRLRGTTYVTNTSPMHSPFHIYEFGLRSFELNGKRSNYEIAHHDFMVCSIYNIPRIFHPILARYMERTDTGLQLSIWLRKPASSRSP